MVAVGEAAELQVLLTLKDQLSPALATTQARITELQGAGGLGGLSGLASKVESAFGGVGNALSHAASQIGGLVKNIGLFGGAIGLFSVAGAIKNSIDTASQMALSIEKLTGLTGESATAMSGLLAVFGKFNISADQFGTIVGFAEKTLGNLSKTSNTSAASLAKDQDAITKATEKLNVAELKQQEIDAKSKSTDAQRVAAANAVADAKRNLAAAEDKLTTAETAGGIGASKLAVLDKQYGLNLIDATGHVVDFSTELAQVSDYYISNASATSKAALAAQLFGRGYAALIPVLQLGSAGIKELETTAQSLGLVLTEQNVTDLKTYQEGMRNLGDAVGGLELQVSLALIPALTTLASNLTSFIATNRDNIVQFFRDAANFAGDLAGVVTKDVVPAIKAIVGWWNGLPGPLKEFLVGAFVAGKVSKFLFDVNIPGTLLTLGVKWAADFVLHAVAGLAGDILGFATGGAVAAGEIGGAMAVGGTTAAAEMEAAMAAGGLTAAGELEAAMVAAAPAAGFSIATVIGKLLGIALPAAGVAIGVSEAQKFLDPNRNPFTGQYDPLGTGGVTSNPISSYGAPGFFGGNPSPSMIAAASQGVAGGTGGNVGQDQYGNVAGAANSLADALKNAAIWAGNWTSALQKSEVIANKNFLHGKDVGTSADTITSYFQSLSSNYFDPSKTGIGNLTKEITRFKDEAVMEAKHGNTTLADKLNADAAKLQAIKDKLTATNSDLATANQHLATIAAKKNTFISYLYADLSYTVRSGQTQNFRSNLYGRSIAE